MLGAGISITNLKPYFSQTNNNSQIECVITPNNYTTSKKRKVFKVIKKTLQCRHPEICAKGCHKEEGERGEIILIIWLDVANNQIWR